MRAVPSGERRAWRAASRYVAGTTAGDALDKAHELARRSAGSSLDQFGELVTEDSVADAATDDYLALADGLHAETDGVWLSIDLSHIGLDLDRSRCAERLAEIARQLPAGRRIQVGAEDFDRADAVFECVLAAAGRGVADRLGATVQANFHRSDGDLERLVEAGLYIRLVKGAYVEPPAHALPYGEATDANYVRLAHRLGETDAEFALATHDEHLRETLLSALGPRPCEQLLGVRPEILGDLVSRGIPIRIYVPFGKDWFRYWMRRVAESRGA